MKKDSLNNIFADFDKMKKVVCSAKGDEQRNVAWNCINAFENKWFNVDSYKALFILMVEELRNLWMDA